MSKSMRACSNDDATITHSPRGATNGPLTDAAPMPATSVVLPLPGATLKAASATSSQNAQGMPLRSNSALSAGSPG